MMFKKIILGLMLLFIAATSSNAGLSAVVHNTAGATTLEDSITVSFVVTDSIDNMSGLDSIFVVIWNAKGDSVYAAAYITTASEIDSVDLVNGLRTVWRWSEQVSDIDATGRIGTYTGIIIAVDTLDGTGAEYLDNFAFFSFQLINAEYAALIDSGAASVKPTTSGRTLDITATGEAGLDLDNTSGDYEIGDFNGISAFWNEGKTGYTLTQSFPTNFSSFGITAGGYASLNIGAVTGTYAAADFSGQTSFWNEGKTGYTLTSQDWTTDADLAPFAYFDTLIYIGPKGLGVYIDSAAANTNTVIGTDGTSKNPVSTIAAAKTIATALGSNRYYIINQSTFNDAANDLSSVHDNWEFVGLGHEAALAFGAQSVDGSNFFNLDLSGAMHASGSDAQYIKCDLGFISANYAGHAFECYIGDTLVLKNATDVEFDNCQSGLSGVNIPTIDFSAGSSAIRFSNYSGGLRLMNATTLDTISIEIDGQIIISANNTTLHATISGMVSITDSGTTTDLNVDAVFNRPQVSNPIMAYFDTLIYLGGVWVDAGANTNTVIGVDGTPKNPVGTIAAAKTIADNLGYATIYFLDGANETIGETMKNYRFTGITRSATVNLGGQDVDSSFFECLTITGEQGGTNSIIVINAALSNVDSLEMFATNCAIIGDLSLRAGTSSFDKCYSFVPGNATPVLDFNDVDVAVGVNWRAYSGGLELKNMTVDHTISYESDGQLIINANSDNATVVARGMMSITNNGTSINLNDDAVFSRQDADSWVAIKVWNYIHGGDFAGYGDSTSNKPAGYWMNVAGDSALLANVVDIANEVQDSLLYYFGLEGGTGNHAGKDSNIDSIFILNTARDTIRLVEYFHIGGSSGDFADSVIATDWP